MLYISILIITVAVLVVVKVFPIISGYGAKNLCSNIFVCNRAAEDVIENELARFPINLAKYSVNYQAKTVTASVFGLARKKAVYRAGLGATVLNEVDEKTLLAQKVTLATGETFSPAACGNLSRPWLEKPLATTIDETQLNKAIEYAFGKAGSKGTRAVVVLHRGQLVAERYAPKFSANSKLAGWSMAKSITNALIGVLIKQQKLHLHSPAPIAEWKNDARREITTANLLQMSCGLRWWEYYAAPSDATNMLYMEKNMAGFALRKKLRHKPGSRYNYSSGTTNILSHIIRQLINEEDYYRFPYEQLFYKAGMSDIVLEVDAAGTFVGSSYCFATARDWAKFGMLYLNDGVYKGERILPEGWVDFTTTPIAAELADSDGTYGAQFWLNKPNKRGNKKYPQVPEDCFRCQGYEGQYIWIVPSENLVVVRLALEKGDILDANSFLPEVIKAFH